jgi:hypothetical protein
MTNVLRVYRVHADGSRNRVLTAGRALLNGTWSGYDYHPPFNESFTYVASTGVEADSAPSAAQFIPSDEVWLLHPSDPARSYMVDKILAPQQSVTRSSRATEFQILGSSKTVIRTDSPFEAVSGSFTIRVALDDVSLVESLFADDIPVLLNGPWGRYDYGWQWIWVKSISRSNSGGKISFPTRNYEVSYKVVSGPDVDIEPVWTYADATAEFTGAYTTTDGVWASYGDSRIDRRA